jgi:hypothetical protein
MNRKKSDILQSKSNHIMKKHGKAQKNIFEAMYPK